MSTVNMGTPLSADHAQFADRSADTFPRHSVCYLPFGELEQVLTWCRTQCKSDWRWAPIETAAADKGQYKFYFDSDSDAVAFLLQWS